MSEYVKLEAYFDALKLPLNANTLSDRLRIQKIVYMLEELGAQIGFKFIWYIHGPYSPELTKVYYNPLTEGTKEKIQINEDAIRKLKRLIGDDVERVDMLELIASLIVLIKYGRNSGINSRKKIYEFIYARKPHFSDEDIDYCWNKLKVSGLFEHYFETIEGEEPK